MHWGLRLRFRTAELAARNGSTPPGKSGDPAGRSSRPWTRQPTALPTPTCCGSQALMKTLDRHCRGRIIAPLDSEARDEHEARFAWSQCDGAACARPERRAQRGRMQPRPRLRSVHPSGAKLALLSCLKQGLTQPRRFKSLTTAFFSCGAFLGVTKHLANRSRPGRLPAKKAQDARDSAAHLPPGHGRCSCSRQHPRGTNTTTIKHVLSHVRCSRPSRKTRHGTVLCIVPTGPLQGSFTRPPGLDVYGTVSPERQLL